MAANTGWSCFLAKSCFGWCPSRRLSFTLHPNGHREFLITLSHYPWLFFMYPALESLTLVSQHWNQSLLKPSYRIQTFRRGPFSMNHLKMQIWTAAAVRSVWNSSLDSSPLQICPILTFQMASWGDILQKLGVQCNFN